jgi:eukaryotic-like serine/threonine-protein kinase
MPLEGLQLGKYRLVRLIGSGGMGDVYMGEDARLSRQLAIKVMRAEVSPYPDEDAVKEAARLFQREMKAIARLDHPHILTLFRLWRRTPSPNHTDLYGHAVSARGIAC